LGRRSSEYRAPTWSPFSLDREDSTEHPRDTEWGTFDYFDGDWEFDTGDSPQTYRATVMDASCEPAGVDPTGSVKAGFLQIKGRVLRGPNICPPFENLRLPSGSSEPSDLSEGWGSVGKLNMSILWAMWVDPTKWDSITLVLIGTHGRDSFLCHYAIVLVASAAVVGAFERVGMAKTNHEGAGSRGCWFPTEEEEFTIV